MWPSDGIRYLRTLSIFVKVMMAGCMMPSSHNLNSIRDVAIESPGGATPPGNLPAPPGNFTHHTFLGKFKPPTNLLAT